MTEQAMAVDLTKATTEELVSENQKLGAMIERLREARRPIMFEIKRRLQAGEQHPMPEQPPAITHQITRHADGRVDATVHGQTLVATASKH